MSKFLLNLLLQISKALVYSKIYFLFEKNSPQILAYPAQPRLCWPALPHRPPGPCSTHSPRTALACLPKGVFPSTLRIPATTPSLSHITAMWAPPISFIPFPTLANLSHVAASPRRLRPPCATRSPTSRCKSKSLLPHLDSPF
jgi:hypothetical protein